MWRIDYQQSALLAVLCCHLATENVMDLATSQHGGGVCCAFAPQLVHSRFDFLEVYFPSCMYDCCNIVASHVKITISSSLVVNAT